MSKLIYLDNSATSYPKPESVYDFMNTFYRTKGVSPGRSGFDAAIETEEVVNNTRKMLTRLFNGGADHNRLTFSYNATDSLNLIINGLVEKGDHVVTTMLEHNSVLRPLYHHTENGTIETTFVPFNSEGYVDPKDIGNAIRHNTKFVIVTHCSNVLGTIQPIKEIGVICKEKGVIFVVDGSQGAGSVEFDMQDCNVDVYCFTGHKCLMGPTGIGGSYVREGIEIKHTRAGGTGVRSAHLAHLNEYPYRLEYGTLNLLGVGGLYAGVKWITEQGITNIHEREMDLWEHLVNEIKKIKGVVTYCANGRENKNPVVSFNIEGFEAADVGTMLDVDYNIAVRTGLQCAPFVHKQIGTFDMHGTVRMSIGAFTTREEIDTAIEAIREIASIKN
ncbi:MAG: aminotransferase class V-fold PLP-dependent enzyme [Bacteroidales bacterium]|jgi:cysteine desulfurase family protein|nr:aminotransferase class V-fold PLP-dependent enzyme [Bacteroidales bacterium]